MRRIRNYFCSIFGILGTIFLILGVAMFLIGISTGAKFKKFQEEGVKIDAVVTNITTEKSRGADGETKVSHTAYVSYYAEGEYYQDIRLSLYTSSMRVGGTTPIYYMPDDPTDIMSAKTGGFLNLFTIIGCIFSPIAIVFVVLAIKGVGIILGPDAMASDVGPSTSVSFHKTFAAPGNYQVFKNGQQVAGTGFVGNNAGGPMLFDPTTGQPIINTQTGMPYAAQQVNTQMQNTQMPGAQVNTQFANTQMGNTQFAGANQSQYGYNPADYDMTGYYSNQNNQNPNA